MSSRTRRPRVRVLLGPRHPRTRSQRRVCFGSVRRAFLAFRSDLSRHDKRFAIAAVSAGKDPIRLLVVDDEFCRGIEWQRATQAVRRVREVDQRARHVSFFNRRAQLRGVAAPDAVDEVREVVIARFAVRSGRLICAEPALVAEWVLVDCSQVAFRSVEDAADRIVLAEEARPISTSLFEIQWRTFISSIFGRSAV